MMAFGHCASGWLAAMLLINWLSLFTDIPLAAAALLSLASALAMAGAAIVNDWDYEHSTISTAFGPFSKAIHKGIVELHYMACSVTADAGTRKPPGPHRGVTHWWPFPLVIGGLVAWGCWSTKWVLFSVLCVLYSAAIRGLTMPDYMPRAGDTIRHRWTMLTAHGLIDLAYKNPWLGGSISLGLGLLIGWLSAWSTGIMFAYGFAIMCLAVVLSIMHMMKRARRYVTRTRRYGTYWHHITIPVGKLTTACMGAVLALITVRFDYVVDHGVWLGALVCVGMYIHILGDSPTEMGIPGIRLTRFWRLPKWLAFRAGGPFEIVFCWIPMIGLDLYLLPGLRPHEEVLMVQSYIIWALGALVSIALAIEYASRFTRKRVWR